MALTKPGDETRGQSVTFQNVSRRYGPVVAVQDVSLEVLAGEFVSLLGPSGSGKTTLLMMLAGFEQPDAGRIRVGATDITRLAPNKREVAMVFQRYALFPHMTVAQNIAFPLRTRKVKAAEQAIRVQKALEMVQLAEYANRRPAQLSGGQQQRVALARAIVFNPTVILMDEPLGALDKNLRRHMQLEIKQLQQQLGATVVYVTHDQEEALTMSDRVAVMDKGRLVQVGAPRELYDRPDNAFVAGFMGEMNFLHGRLVPQSGAEYRVVLPGGSLLVENPAPAMTASTRVLVAVRPERMQVRPGPARDGRLGGQVIQSVFNGTNVTLLVSQPGGTTLRADLSTSEEAGPPPPPGAEVELSCRPEDIHLFPDAS